MYNVIVFGWQQVVFCLGYFDDWYFRKINTHSGDLTITREKKNLFLGSNITLTKDGKVKIGMKDKLHKYIDAFGEKIEVSITSLSIMFSFAL